MATYTYGGAAAVLATMLSEPSFEYSVFYDNKAPLGGGAVSVYGAGANPTFESTEFIQNKVSIS